MVLLLFQFQDLKVSVCSTFFLGSQAGLFVRPQISTILYWYDLLFEEAVLRTRSIWYLSMVRIKTTPGSNLKIPVFPMVNVTDLFLNCFKKLFQLDAYCTRYSIVEHPTYSIYAASVELRVELTVLVFIFILQVGFCIGAKRFLKQYFNQNLSYKNFITYLNKLRIIINLNDSVSFASYSLVESFYNPYQIRER